MKIFIDAGHNYSSFNTGASGFGLREQDVTWEIASSCGMLLENAGLETKLSRPKITDILGKDNSSSLVERVKTANDWNCDYFVSIHCNAGGGTGTESYAYKSDTVAEKLAQVVNDRIVRQLKLKDRGVKFANFYVLKYTKAPAILIETAFIDNANDNELLKNKKGEFADAISSAICEFLNWKEGDLKVQTVNEAIEKLAKKEIINSPEYWEKACEIVKYLDELLIKFAESA